MLLRTHLSVAGTVAVLTAPTPVMLPAVAGCLVGAWAPDLDAWLGPRREGRSPFSTGLLRHRAVTHSFLFLAVTTPLLFFALSSVVDPALAGWSTAYYALGFISHVLLDSMTRSPVYVWWPSGRGFHLPDLFRRAGIRNGSRWDKVIGTAGAIVFVVALAFRGLGALQALAAGLSSGVGS